MFPSLSIENLSDPDHTETLRVQDGQREEARWMREERRNDYSSFSTERKMSDKRRSSTLARMPLTARPLSPLGFSCHFSSPPPPQSSFWELSPHC